MLICLYKFQWYIGKESGLYSMKYKTSSSLKQKFITWAVQRINIRTSNWTLCQWFLISNNKYFMELYTSTTRYTKSLLLPLRGINWTPWDARLLLIVVLSYSMNCVCLCHILRTQYCFLGPSFWLPTYQMQSVIL